MNYARITFIMFFIIYSFYSCKKDDDGTNQSQFLKEITGSVKDENKNAYPNTRVKLLNPSNDLETRTNSDGGFGFNIDKEGHYTITIVPPLSSTLISEDLIDVDVKIGAEKTINFIVQPQPLDALIVKGSVDIFGEIRNEAGLVPNNSDEPIYARNIFDSPIGMLTPIKAPNGDHLTLSEWETAKGKVVTNCNGNTSKVEINLQGMIPNGTYTFWLNFLNKKKTPGQSLNISEDVANIEPLGSGTLNVVQASSNGSISATINHSSCILTKEVALVLVVVYHINGNTFGSEHIPDIEDVSQMLIYFQ